MTMEIIIKSPTEGQYIQNIDFNFEELKKAISENVAKYDNLIYSEEQIKIAKTDRANLNKFIDVLDSKRKEIKNKCLAPYTEFEAKIKELQELVKTPVAKIDNQIKTYEDGKKAEKRTAISIYYKENGAEIADLIELDSFFNDKWLNSSVNIASVYKEIDGKIEHIRSDLKAITALNSEFILQIKDKYLQTLNLSAALQENERLTAQKEKIARFEKNQPAPAITQTVAEVSTQPQEKAAEEVFQIDFRVWVTEKQMDEIREFLTANNIKYGKVK